MNRKETNKKINFRGWYVVFISAMVGCTIAATFPQFSMTVNQLALQMNVSNELLLGSDTIKSFAIVVSMLISGIVYKKIGARNTFIVALLFLVITQFMLPFTHSVGLLLFLKVLQGLSSIVFPVLLLIIMGWMDPSQTGLSLAVFNGIFYGGGGIGGTIAGIAIANSGWRSSYFVLGIVALVLGIVWLFTVKENTKSHRIESADNSSNTGERLSVQKLLLLPTVWLLIIGFFSTTFVLQAITVDMPIFVDFLGYTELQTGKLMSSVTIGIIASCLISGKCSDILAAKMKSKGKARVIVMMVGPVLIICSSLLLTLLDSTSFSLLYLTVSLFSFGAAWGLGTYYSILPEIFDGDSLSIVTGFSGGIADLGMPLAPFLIGVTFGSKGLWDLGWLSCAFFALLSLISLCSLFLSKVRLDIFHHDKANENTANKP